MGIKHEAFLDLEEGLLKNLVPAWDGYWEKAGAKVADAADEQRWDDAHAAVEAVDLAPVAKKARQLLSTVGMASLLLGASRYGRTERTAVYKNPPKDWLTSAVGQMEALLSGSATRALRQDLHVHLDRREFGESEANTATLTEVMKSGAVYAMTMKARGSAQGAAYLELASNMHVSRLSSAGFLLEATSRGDGKYQINSVLDARVCPVCRKLHGQEFLVRDGVRQLASVFATTDPTALAALAPWPKRNKTGVARLSRMSNADLREARYTMPPFHPRCRCILVKVGEIPVIEGLGVGMGMAEGLSDGSEMLDRMMGDRSDLEEAADGMFSVGATSALAELEAEGESVSDEHDEAAGGALLATALGFAAGLTPDE